jgi:hypothetical protein
MTLALQMVGEGPEAAVQLVRELVREGVDASLAADPAPPGTKSGLAVTAGLLISGLLSAPVVQALVQVVLARFRRGQPGAITFTDGDRELTIENASPETEQALVSWLTEREH